MLSTGILCLQLCHLLQGRRRLLQGPANNAGIATWQYSNGEAQGLQYDPYAPTGSVYAQPPVAHSAGRMLLWLTCTFALVHIVSHSVQTLPCCLKWQRLSCLWWPLMITNFGSCCSSRSFKIIIGQTGLVPLNHSFVSVKMAWYLKESCEKRVELIDMHLVASGWQDTTAVTHAEESLGILASACLERLKLTHEDFRLDLTYTSTCFLRFFLTGVTGADAAALRIAAEGNEGASVNVGSGTTAPASGCFPGMWSSQDFSDYLHGNLTGSYSYSRQYCIHFLFPGTSCSLLNIPAI